MFKLFNKYKLMDELEPKQILINKIKKWIPIFLCIIFGAILIYQYVWVSFKEGIYNEGYQAGLQDGQGQVWSGLANQFQSLGRLELPAKTPNGEMGTIIFLPQQQ